MIAIIDGLKRLHDAVFGIVERLTDGWFFGLLCRLVFAATLYTYYLNSAKTKVGDGILGFFRISTGAYYQIVPDAVATANSPAALGLSYKLMVIAGTYAEFILPILVILGLFLFVQTYVDVTAHDVPLGSFFNGKPTELLDTRVFWALPLVYVAIRGPGRISIDRLLSRWWARR
jgi:putative oxidoreductase